MGDSDEDLAKELEPILDSYKVDDTKEDAVNEEKMHEFLVKFERIKVEIIRPVMEQIGEYLEKKGHSYDIKDEAGTHYDNPSIRMEIYPKTPHDAPVQEHEFPAINFIAEPDIDEVGIEVRNGMPGRPGLTRGHAVNLDAITKEYTKKQIVDLIKRNFMKSAV